MALSADELIATIHYQVAALEGMALTAGVTPAYIKPHGALYNDMMSNPEVRASVMQAVAEYHRSLQLMMQATPAAEDHVAEAREAGIEVIFEAFADRCYEDDGRLMSRRKPGAVHDHEKMMAQVRQLAANGSVTTASGKTLALRVDTLCVHGDNPEGVAAIREIREMLNH
jgi:UPF0271 protein